MKNNSNKKERYVTHLMKKKIDMVIQDGLVSMMSMRHS